jgi:hypothetical protein
MGGIGMTVSKFFFIFVGLFVLDLIPAHAESAGGKACLDSCRNELKRAGTWNSLPKGYCRRKCNYWAGAPADAKK